MGNSDVPLQQLSQCVLTTEQIRAVDRRAMEKYGMHSLVLMENAGLGCVSWLRARFESPPDGKRPRTVILCGAGNNGGDGLVIARHLRAWGWPCELFVLGSLDKLSTDAQANAKILLADSNNELHWSTDKRTSQHLSQEIARAELLIDAMLGTGATGNPRAPLDHWIHLANASSAMRVAVDIPTGVDATTGSRGTPSFLADATLTFVAFKPAMAKVETSSAFGEITVLPIGIPVALIKELVTSDQ